MPTVEEQMALEMQKQFGGAGQVNNDDAAKAEADKIANEAAAAEAEKNKSADSEAEKLAETQAAEKLESEKKAKEEEEKNKSAAPVKSFEEYLAEKSGGKYNKWEDLETALTPKEVFANEKIKHLNELAAKGVDVTSREFLEIQSKDFEKLDKSDDILFEKWKLGEEGKGLSEKSIRHEINKKYNVDGWIDKEDDDLTADDIANQEKMNRDAVNDKQWLIDYKNERTLEKAEDPKVAAAMAEQQKTFQSNWEKFVDSDLVNKITKYTTPIYAKDGKTVESEFNFDISDQDRKEFGSIMKQLPVDTNAFFGQFIKKGEDGKVTRDDAALFNMMVRAKNYDKAVALAYSDGAAKEALRIEKEQKNSNFKQNESGQQKTVHTDPQKALAEAVNKMKI